MWRKRGGEERAVHHRKNDGVGTLGFFSGVLSSPWDMGDGDAATLSMTRVDFVCRLRWSVDHNLNVKGESVSLLSLVCENRSAMEAMLGCGMSLRCILLHTLAEVLAPRHCCFLFAVFPRSIFLCWCRAPSPSTTSHIKPPAGLMRKMMTARWGKALCVYVFFRRESMSVPYITRSYPT